MNYVLSLVTIFSVMMSSFLLYKKETPAPKMTECADLCPLGLQEVEQSISWDGEVYTKCSCK